MNKIIISMMLFFFINSSFAAAINSVSATSELVENSWYTKESMSQARSRLGVVAVDGKIYAIGGSTFETVVGTNERYDPKTDTWTPLASMPTPRSNFGIVACQNKIYCIGGSSFTEHGLLIVEVYDPVANSWSTKASSLGVEQQYVPVL
ncbi:MAG: hypothetical protein FWB84_02615 [Candidatus Bathyarchaeota archaeon]|uniref:Kelch repeat-containing protein n=1 Tax=Candidatus Bathycorpusculum sp. TaxID=2994959 RepID=UPI0028237DC9|nr:hypothetical protein [Candidatus Termiticorpusculum sp.]MCL2257435.1 hypothetical protein [Candidatus Termiticorpusculum sp.]MCL2292462.1 hypothetical protein [Candidatus Termiticorpusculum sp.]